MSEVSCKALDPLFILLKRKKVAPEEVLDGVSYSLADLRNKHSWIEWDAYCRILENADKVLTREDHLSLGRVFFRSPFVRPLTIIPRLLFTTREFYRWVMTKQTGAGNQLITCMRPSYREIADDRFELTLSMKEGYSGPSESYYLHCQSILASMPELFALPQADVSFVAQEKGATFSVRIPMGGGKLAGVRKAITWPFTARAAAKELKEAHEVLQSRFQELESANSHLDRQATQLQTAQEIANLVHGDLALSATVEAVACALIEQGGFLGVRLHVDTEMDGLQYNETVEQGHVLGDAPLVEHLMAGPRKVGVLSLWIERDADPEERSALLLRLVAPISLALEQALAYSAVLDYRSNLEQKVKDRTRELREAQAAKDKIFANINHEIRTPLSLIVLLLNRVKQRGVYDAFPEAEADHGHIMQNVQSLLKQVDDLLLLAASDEVGLKLRPEPHDLHQFLVDVVDMWRSVADQNGLRITYAGDNVGGVGIDRESLLRALSNLLSNAMKFTPKDGEINVSLVRGEDFVVEVSDTGVGIDEEKMDTIFDRFVQDKKAVRKIARGSGVGLSIVKAIVEAHEGTISVRKGDFQGTVFSIRLPGHLERDVVGVPSAEKKLSVSGPEFIVADGMSLEDTEEKEVFEANDLAEATILVAEDNSELRKIIVEVLRERYRVVAASNGRAALELAIAHRPDLLLTDIGMPEMDGLELTQHFRDIEGLRLAPVIILTAYGDVKKRIAGFQSGALDYLTKPFSPEELMARVAGHLMLREHALKLMAGEKQAALGMLTAGLAHELRNPANGLVNAIEPLKFLLAELESSEVVDGLGELFGVVETCAEQIRALSSELIGMSSFESAERSVVRTEKIVSDALLIADKVTSNPIAVEIESDREIACSRPLVVSVLVTLLNNARHAAGPAGKVSLRCKSLEGGMGFHVLDDGGGVEAELRERIFEPFFTTKEPGEGTGLGLANARKVVASHGGSLSLLPSETGAHFRVVLPLALTAVDAQSARDEMPAASRAS